MHPDVFIGFLTNTLLDLTHEVETFLWSTGRPSRPFCSLMSTDEGVASEPCLASSFRVNGHVVIPQLAEAARNPRILDIVEAILGPDLLAWSVELFIKEPGSVKTVSWHQDITYWGMGETDDEVTAWIALSDVSIEAGCMRFLPGSHKGGLVAHNDTFADDNLLSRGQQIADVHLHGPIVA